MPPGPATSGGRGLTTEIACGLTTRRWHQLSALSLGVLETVFSVYNAVVEDSFKFEDGADFVFSASAAMEGVGLGVMLLIALCRTDGDEAGGRREEARGHKVVMEGFGSPLAILVNGVRQMDPSLTKVGHLGAVSQAAVVGIVGLALLQKVDARAFVIVFYLLLVLTCGFCFVTANDFFANCFRNALVVSRLDSLFDPHDPALGLTYALILLPLGVDVAEIVLLVLEGKSWNSTVLAVLDVGLVFAVVFPFGYKRFMRSCPEVARRFGRDCPCLHRRLDSVVNALFV